MKEGIFSQLNFKLHELRLHSKDRFLLPIARMLSPRQWSDEPLVSIVIPTYNRSDILCERTIPAILQQDYQHFEILVVGDHVIDDTKEKIAKIGDKRVRFYDLPCRGSYPSDPKLRWFVQGSVPRNTSHSLLRGEGICCISDDDIVYSNHLSSLVSHAKSSGAEFITAAYDVIVNGEKIHRRKQAGVDAIGIECGGMLTWLYRSYLKCFEWNTQSWRKPWNRPCDYDLILRMWNAGVRFSYTDEVVAFVPAVKGTNSTGIAAAR